MATFQYEASSAQGKLVKGVRAAADEAQLRAALAGEGLALIEAREAVKQTASERLTAAETAEFCRQLGAMLSAGVTLVRAIGILINRDLKPRVRSVYTSLYGYLQAGNSLSEAMELQGGFPALLVSAMRASESSGRMDAAAQQMAVHYEKEYRLDQKIKTAAFYPLFLLGLTIVIVALIFKVILPRFFTLFEGMQLPAMTQFVLNLSNAFSDHGFIILAGVLTVVFLLILAARIPAVRLRLDRFKLRLPYIGRLLKIIYTSRFARTLSSLYASGLTILSALQTTRDTIGNTYVASQFDGVIADVRAGSSLSAAVAKVDGFDSKLNATVAIGEESGNLDAMLTSIADSFDYESEQAMTKLTALIEPVLIILMAVIIGFVMISVMLPILQLYDTIGSGYGSF
ncbi:MAG: type II secretion system F family protein [Oscillospiraceae bacterium]|nr:type II secretion system F family protein [Oscillospiraceae bacterium]